MINILLLAAKIAFGQDYVMDMRRVFLAPDGKVLVLMVAPNACSKGEMKKSCFERIAAHDCPKDNANKCLSSFDTDRKSLPDWTKRDKWRAVDPKDPSKGIKIDETVVPRAEKIAALEAKIDAELAKPNPDPIQVAKMQRQLDKIRATVPKP